MNQSQEAARRARAERIYRWVLHLYPAAHRRAFGEPMLHTFGDYYGDAVQRGRKSPARFWLGVVGDESRSLVREHVAALVEGAQSMDKLVFAVYKLVCIMVGLLMWVAVLDLLFPITGAVPYFWLPATVIYAALLFLVARFMCRVPRPEWRGSWGRLGLMLGAILGLDMVALNVLNALMRIGSAQAAFMVGNLWPVQALSLPLLAGVVGVLGGYASGKMRAGVAAGALSGGIMLVIQSVGVVLLMVLWNAVHHPAPPPAFPKGLVLHQVIMGPVMGPDFYSSYLINAADDAGLPFGLLVQCMLTVLVWPVPLLVGSALGARAARRADEAYRPEIVAAAPSGRAAQVLTRSIQFISFTLLLLVLGPVLWSSATEAQVLTQGTIVYGNVLVWLEYLGTTSGIWPFLAWLLAVLMTLVAMHVTVRPNAVRQEVNTAPSR
ncbi:MAG: hypothetical protein ACLQUY_24285 [Ktedonobacterales bacterium]